MDKNTQIEEGFHPLPQPDEIPVRDREDAMGSYLMMFASLAVGLPFPLFNLIASIVYYQLNKKKSRFVKFHAFQSLISQAPVSVLNAVVISWGVYNLFTDRGFDESFWGLLAAVAAVNIAYFIFSIIGAIKARRGEMYYFIYFGRESYIRIFSIKPWEEDIETDMPKINIPPKF